MSFLPCSSRNLVTTNPKNPNSGVMDGSEVSSELSSFQNSGIYHLDGSNVVFLDPVRILNGSYTRFSLSPSAYYSRSFHEPQPMQHAVDDPRKKRKRKRKAARDLNEREIAAERRHQEIRPLLVSAHGALLRAGDLLRFLPNVMKGDDDDSSHDASGEEQNLIKLGSQPQSAAYEISLCFGSRDAKEGEG